MKVFMLGSGTSSGIPLFNCLARTPIGCDVCSEALRIEGFPEDGRSVKFNKNRRRNSSCLVKVELKNGSIKNVLIDCGKSFYETAITWFLEFQVVTIDAVLITHGHADAMMGMDDLRMWTAGGKKGQLQESVPVFLDAETYKVVDRAFPYLTDTKLATGSGEIAALDFNLFDPSKPLILFGEVEVRSFYVQHGFLNDGEPYYSLGFRIDDFSYISDVSHIPEDSKGIIKGSRVIIIDALRPHPHRSHFGFGQAIAACNELLEPGGRGYFTGLGHDIVHDEISEWLLEQEFPTGNKMFCGFDGIEIQL